MIAAGSRASPHDGTPPSLADWGEMNDIDPVPETPVVGRPPVLVDPVAPAVAKPAPKPSPVPKPSPEDALEFWKHVIR
jgi:hypothetical protein